MLTDAELAGMRDTSRSALPDTGRITRPDAPGALDPVTGEYPDRTSQTIYEGPMRVRQQPSVEQDLQFGRLPESIGRYVATLPWDVGPIRVDDYLVVTTSSDPELVGRPMRITHINVGSWSIDRRVSLEEPQRQPQPGGA